MGFSSNYGNHQWKSGSADPYKLFRPSTHTQSDWNVFSKWLWKYGLVLQGRPEFSAPDEGFIFLDGQ